MNDFEKDLNAAISSQPQHLSLYALEVHVGTVGEVGSIHGAGIVMVAEALATGKREWVAFGLKGDTKSPCFVGLR